MPEMILSKFLPPVFSQRIANEISVPPDLPRVLRNRFRKAQSVENELVLQKGRRTKLQTLCLRTLYGRLFLHHDCFPPVGMPHFLGVKRII